MKSLKVSLVLVMTLVLGLSPLAAENWTHEKYADFGIESIGIYTNGYRDTRASSIDLDYQRAAKFQDVRYFRNTLAGFSFDTPRTTRFLWR